MDPNDALKEQAELLELAHDAIIVRDIDDRIATADITESKRIVEALRESEARYRRLADNARDIIFRYRYLPTFGLDYVNPAVTGITGYTPDELYADPDLMLRNTHPDDRSLAQAAASGCFDRGRPIVMRFIRRDGAVVWLEQRVVPVLDAAGCLMAVEGIIRDITESKRIEMELRLQGEIVKNMAEGVCLVKASDGAIVYANPKFERIFGYAPGEMAGKPISIVNAPGARSPEDTTRVITNQLTEAGTWNGEIQNIRKDGTVFWSRASISMFDHPQYGRVGVTVQEDIDDRKRASDALRESEEKYRQFVEESSDGLMLIDERGLIAEWNRAREELTGLKRENVIGQPYWEVQQSLVAPEFQTPENIAARKITFLDALETGQSAIFHQAMEYSICRPDGECRQSQHTLFPIRTRRGCRIGIVTRDITEHRQLERALMDERNLLRMIVDTMGQGLTVTDAKRRFELVNPAYARLFGYQPEDLIGKQPKDVTLAEDHDVLDQARVARRRGETTTYETRLVRADGSIAPVLITATPRWKDGQVTGAIAVITDLTDIKRAEQVLRESEERFRPIFEQTIEGILLADENGNIIEWNRAIEQITGVSRESVIGLPVWEAQQRSAAPEFNTPEIATAQKAMILEALRTGQSPYFNRPIESASVRPDGQRRFFHQIVFPIQTEKGYRIGAVMRDITEVRRSEDALRESAARFSTIFLSSPASIIITRMSDGQIRDVNDAFETMIGYTREALVGHTIHELGLFVDRKVEARVYQELGEKGWIDNWEVGFRTRTGTIGDELISAEVIELSGEPCMIGLGIDITERKRMEKALRASEARFATVFRDSPVSISISRLEDGWIVDANPAFISLFGYSRDEVIGRTSLELGMWVDPDHRSQAINLLLKDGKLYNHEMCIRRKSGDIRSVLLSAEAVDVSGQPHIITLANDITERKQMEETLSRSQKLEALGTLAGGVAHDFNNLLLAISGNAKLAADDLAPDHPVQESLAEITKATYRATNLVRQILAFGRPQEQKFEIIQIQSVVEEALNLLRVSLLRSIKVETHFAAQVPNVSCNATQIHQAVVNLVTNAVQAIATQDRSDHGGRIMVSIDAVNVDTHMARSVPGLHKGRSVRLTVSDDGSGMDQATFKRIFDPFFTTRPFGQGIGLGLSVVYGIVKSHSGAIAVNSQPGQGATFQLYFPAARSAAPPAPAEHHKMASSRGERVLVIDDDDALVFLISRTLKRLGYTVTGHTDPAQALDAFRSQPHAFDVIVTDLSMPGMNGFDLARAMLAARPDVPIVMTTGYIRPEDQELVARLGIRELILKPNTVDELGHALDRLFQNIRKHP